MSKMRTKGALFCLAVLLGIPAFPGCGSKEVVLEVPPASENDGMGEMMRREMELRENPPPPPPMVGN